ncbi:group II intron reverse transcriptase/maturase [Cytophagaceae bacterium ABcell3]|nr:group II intron reverse transcriptase/maturase [Cytophagaceae bacterium ABcell3]WMJ75401.1 group II intron reverse transcriptase/maturase [Cytophagaceae bacterium ABcell3]
MILWNETKSVPISRQMVWGAYKKVKANKGKAGIDSVSMEEFDADRSKYLYKLWNRLASGSYFPPPVKEVEIPKDDGKLRKLGIPTISDRVAQMVIKEYLEPRFEEVFSPDSYGYRPSKSAHHALQAVRLNCKRSDWVIDLDIKGFFDNIDHSKLLLAVKKHVPEKWCLLYIERWLKAPVQSKSGSLIEKQGKGTPQGGVISPLLANLFLHYGMDKWLDRNHPSVKYVRYADDAILHCRSKPHAEYVLRSLQYRMEECKLELHPEKTKLVYCRDYRRTEKFPVVKFDFLGFSFQPRTTSSKEAGKLFVGYDCAISIKSKKRIADKLEALDFEKLSFHCIVGIAGYLNPFIRGWVNYYGKYRKSALHPVFRILSQRIVRWARKRYKRYKTSLKKAYNWLEQIREQFPNLFYHWQLGFK